MIYLAGRGVFICRLSHAYQRFLGKSVDHRAEVLSRNERCNLPVCKRNVFCQNIVNAGYNEPLRCTFYNIKISHNEFRRFHRYRLLIAHMDQ